MILRPIVVPATIERELQTLTRRTTAAWSRELREVVLPAYGAALDQIQRDDASDPIRVALDTAEDRVSRVVLAVSALLGDWVLRVEKWHRRRFASVVRGPTGLDVSPFLSGFDVEDEIAAALERNRSLIRGLSEDIKKDIGRRAYDALINQTPRRKLGKELAERIGIARGRADLIAADQTAKLSSDLDRLRQQQAGIEEYIWRTARDERVRATHHAQEGKRHRWDTPVPDVVRPGYEIRCRCKGQAYFEIEN